MNLGNGKTNQLIWKNTDNRYHVENHNIAMDNPNTSFSVLAQQVIPSSVVLDIACGEGRWGDVLKKKNCEIYGIDIDDAAIHYAEKNGAYKKIWYANVEAMDLDSDVYKKLQGLYDRLDYIGLLDILEHTVNPTRVIQNVVPLIKTGKKILISVPNIGHADIFLNLMNGNFNYQEEGILDNTHTKYFTKRSFLQWIKEINESDFGFKLDCTYLGGTFATTEYLNSIERDYPGLYFIIQQNPEFNIIQLLFELTKVDSADDTPQLNTLLLDDPQVNLFGLIEKSVRDNYLVLSEIKKVSLSWNERDFYKQQVQYFQNREEALKKENVSLHAQISAYHEKLLEKETSLQQATQEWERNADGWKKCDEQLRSQNELLETANEEWKRNAEGWKNCDKELQNLIRELNEKDKFLEKSSEELQRVAGNWKDCDAQLQNALKNMRVKDELLENASKEWKRNAEGWKVCDTELQAVQSKLYIQEQERAALATELEKEKDFSKILEQRNYDLENDVSKLAKELRKVKESKLWPLIKKTLKE